ncbi:hypothetical protein O2W14_13095 [Modestobacter sp. VKM Ac-2986]|uniref:reprolysin-like metallopeptidase n=1 Tax=Modestobacter sp. VKM Ac-2986 TaxID=3004140 RepID=UPI0022AB9803|nr:hypothetical protein [Modestobacter sp. VKM Ac-2986]MCZ2829772.1 hypothetical protein [Modestobacter sp. VKM Ac-2986]
MRVLHRPWSRRGTLTGAAVLLAAALPLAVAPPASAVDGPVAAGSTVVGELVQGYADPGPEEHHEAGGDDAHGGLLSWVQTGATAAVRVPTDDVAALDAGDTVRVTLGGQVRDEGVTEAGLAPARDVLSAAVVAPAEPGVTASAVGQQVTVVMLQPAGSSSQRAADPTTLADVVAAVNGPVGDFWARQSGGAVRFAVTAAHDWTTTDATCSAPFALWDAAAQVSGWTPGPGRHLLVYVPAGAPGCAYGMGTVGISLDDGGLAYVRSTATSVIAHEFGHNLGLGHSSAVQCDGAVESGECLVAAYGDHYDVMGVSWGPVGSLNRVQAALLGLLDGAGVAEVSAPTEVTLTPVSAGSGVRAARYADPVSGEVYWLEYRAASGQDAWLDDATANWLRLQAGVTARVENSGDDTSLLLDATPSPRSGWTEDRTTVLPVGVSVPVGGEGLRVTVLRQTATAAVVRVAAEVSPIEQVHRASGGAAGPLGAATAVERCGLRDGGCLRTYERGSIYWSPATGARVVLAGPVADRWARAGWENGALGWPVADATCGLRDGGCFQHFQGGSVYVSAGTPATVVTGALRDRWAASGWENGPLGYPTADQVCGLRDNGCLQRFQQGALYSSPATGARVVLAGAVADRWARAGWENGVLGWPVSDTTCGLPASGCFQHFQGGSVYVSSGSPATVVTGALRDRWGVSGWERGPLGYPTADQVCGLRDGGCFQQFQKGAVYRSTATGARLVLAGPVADRWARAGWENGALGYPTADATCGLRDGGCFQHFQGGSVYVSAATPATVVTGVLRDRWVASGWENGSLGYPTADQVCGLRDGGCFQQFQGGSVYWSPATGAHPVEGDIRTRWGQLGWENGQLGYPSAGVVAASNGDTTQRFQGGTLHRSASTRVVRVL